MTTRPRASSADTRRRIIRATIDTLGAEGMVGTTARAIARTGGFNQALIYYHFESLEGLFFAVVEHVNDRRLELFGPRLESVETVADLVSVAVELQRGDPDPTENAASALVVAGWSGTSEHGPKVLAALKPWDEAVAGALRRITAGSSLGDTIPIEATAHAISALFLGLELLARLDPDDTSTSDVFEALTGLGGVMSNIMRAFPARPAES